MGGASGLSHAKSYNTGRLWPSYESNAHDDLPGIINESDMEALLTMRDDNELTLTQDLYDQFRPIARRTSQRGMVSSGLPISLQPSLGLAITTSAQNPVLPVLPNVTGQLVEMAQ